MHKSRFPVARKLPLPIWKFKIICNLLWKCDDVREPWNFDICDLEVASRGSYSSISSISSNQYNFSYNFIVQFSFRVNKFRFLPSYNFTMFWSQCQTSSMRRPIPILRWSLVIFFHLPLKFHWCFDRIIKSHPIDAPPLIPMLQRNLVVW